MQQIVRDSVASLFENIMDAIEPKVLESTVNAMRMVLSAGGATPKDVSDWIRRPVVVETKAEVKSRPVPPTTAAPFAPPGPWARGSWKPAEEAAYPLWGGPLSPTGRMTKEEAIDFGIAYLGNLIAGYPHALTEKEKNFLNSAAERLELKGKWLSEKQIRWVNTIAARLGYDIINN